jgi:hypothetical protein
VKVFGTDLRMNSRLSKSLKAEFHNSLKAALPVFEKIGTNSGGVIYRQTDSIATTADIYLSFYIRIPRWTVSRSNLRPTLVPEYPFELLPGERTPQAGPRCRIGKFLGSKTDQWWHLNRSHELEPDFEKHLKDRRDIESALSKLPSAVTEAVEKTALVLPQFVKFLG